MSNHNILINKEIWGCKPYQYSLVDSGSLKGGRLGSEQHKT